MKELSIEEKARAYDEALERAKKWYNAPNIDKMPTYGNRVIEEIFPELKESEDERIKEAIITTIHLYYGEPLEDEAKEMIAWLEKQELKSNPYSGVSFSYNDNIWGMCARDNGVDILFNKKLIQHISGEKQGEQKSAEWSEDDEKMYRGVMAVCDVWSTANSFYPKENEDIERLKNWLKSLKTRITWKPSDEQIEALGVATDICSIPEKHYDKLNKLYQDLKKLKT